MAPKVKPIPSYAVAYIRVSTDQQDLSPEAQRSSIEKWAAREGFEVVSWHEEIGVSGGTAMADCPILMEALAALPANRAGTLVVAKRDRLARDALKVAMIEAMVEKAGAKVISAAGEGNGNTATDQLMRRIIDAFAEFERMLISERTKAALAVKRARGEPVGGVATLGETIDWGERDASGNYTRPPRWLENPEEKRIVDLVIARREAGMTVDQVIASLERDGIAPPRKASRWHRTQVNRILARHRKTMQPKYTPPEEVVRLPEPDVETQLAEMMRALRSE